MFATPAVQLNFGGKSEVPTWPGLLVSILISLVVIMFGYKMFIEMITRAKPVISFTKFDPEEFEDLESSNLEELGFKFAFGIIDSITLEDLSD